MSGNPSTNTQPKRFYASKDLSRLFHVSESTIKRLADSGELKCFKTPGGHRRFTAEHVKDFADRFRYRVISPAYDPAYERRPRPSTYLQKENLSTVRELYFAHALRAEHEMLTKILLNRHSAGVPLVNIYTEIVGGTVRRLQNLRGQGKLSDAEDRVATNSITRSMQQFHLMSEKRPQKGKVAVCGSPIRGIEDLFLVGSSHLLEMAGWKVYNLGSNTPLDILLRAVEKYDPVLIFASVAYVLGTAEGRLSHLRLNSAASMRGAEIVFFDFYSTIDPNARRNYPAGLRVATSFQDLAPYTV